MTQAELDTSSVGIEFGSTRIKAVLIDAAFNPVAQGAFDWENSLVDGVWTYSLDLVERGLQTAFAELKADVKNKFGLELRKAKSLGISAMMHGYLAFDKDDNLLVPFRTWRNTITAQASEKLTDLFNFPIPERWSISHLYQAILNNEKHVPQIASINTLAGWVHFKLTGQKVLGIGDASGMFPVDMTKKNYDKKFLAAFDNLVADKKFNWKLEQILPRVEVAGKPAGTLTEAGAKFLDPTGAFEAGCLLAPPEGDAGTGMVATNSVTARTGNVSAGTSVFA
ncbi:MAG: ATPase, partial [Treponema sp.]|nr:ATPase [Treponema sp.]